MPQRRRATPEAPSRARGTLSYTKPALTHTDLVLRMRDRGLEIADVERTERYLRHIGYYRFSPYLIPFRADPSQEAITPGTSFDQVLELYVFDRRLRLLVMDAIERIEVAVRAALTDSMSLTHGGPFWYTDPKHFSNSDDHGGLLKIIRTACRNQLRNDAEAPLGELVHTSALEHYLTTYGVPELPPSWLMVEILTLGQLEQLISNLARIGDVNRVARPLGLQYGPLLLSWLRTFVRVRNVCAHHGRLWNVGLGMYPAIPGSPRVSWLEDSGPLSSGDRRKRLYPVLVALQSVLSTISPNSSWARRLSELLAHRPNLYLRGMGIPADWRLDPFWSARLSDRKG